MAERKHNFQQLFSSNTSLNIAEELGARVKDPLWFLARQWQSGEFEAENGGRPAALGFETRTSPLKTAVFPGAPAAEVRVPLDRAMPLEALVEAEASGVSKAWQSQTLEYAFDLETAAHRLTAREYHGNALDWFHFDLAETTPARPADVKKQKQEVIPTQMHFAGAPHPRWWRFEEGDGYFDTPADVDPNTLSLLMPEFFYTDINNWYIAPVEFTAGSVAEIGDVKITDSFGHVSQLNPVSDPNWKVFELSAKAGAAAGAGHTDGLLLLPNIAADLLHNDEVEDVRFVRDEAANMVWAVERLYRDGVGNFIRNGDGVASPGAANAPPPGDLPAFKLSTQTPAYWIPYVPRKPKAAGAPQGDMYLRRGRTIETASQADPQYSSRVVAESVRVNEEEVPRTGLRVRRIERYARGSDGTAHFWIARVRDSGRSGARSRPPSFSAATKRARAASSSAMSPSLTFQSDADQGWTFSPFMAA